MKNQPANRTRTGNRHAWMRFPAMLLGVVCFACDQPLMVGAMELMGNLDGGQGSAGGAGACPNDDSGEGGSTTAPESVGAQSGDANVKCSAPWPPIQSFGSRTVITLAACQAVPEEIAVDATSVYWTNIGIHGLDDPPYGTGSVMKVPLGGGTPTTLATKQYWPKGLAVDATSVYWSDHEMVMKMPLGGGCSTRLVSTGSAGQIALDAENLYWVGEPQAQSHSPLMATPLAGGRPVMLVDNAVADFGGIVVDATNLYWASGGTVMKLALSGGTPTTLASEQQQAARIAVDATHVYWTNVNGGTVMRVPLQGGPATVLASKLPNPYAIVADATHVYWTNLSDGNVMKVPLGGGTPTVLASLPCCSGDGIAVDATSVYWTNTAFYNTDNPLNGTIMKVTPK